MSAPRVLEVLGRSAGGVARHVALIAAGLDGRDGLAVEVAGPADLPVAMPKPVIEVIVPDGPVRGHRRAVARLREVIASGFDVVHAHGLRAGIDSCLAARGLAPVVVSVHNLVLPEIAGRARALAYGLGEPLVVRMSEVVLAPSRDIARRLREKVPGASGKIEVVYLGVAEPPPVMRSRQEIRSELGLIPGEALVVTAARLDRQKALDVMLAAVAGLGDDVVLVVMGQGPLEGDLKALAGELGIEGRVRFLGFRSDVADHIAAADVFCLSSLWEACSLAAQEAMLLGTPVVTTDGGGMPELVTDRVSGRLVPVGDVDALNTALKEVLSSPDDAERYVEAATTSLKERFSTEGMLDRLRRVYADLGHA